MTLTRAESESAVVCATLMAEGEQECVGLAITARPTRGHSSVGALPTNALLRQLQGIVAQLGAVPLADLLADAGQATERHLIALALRSAGGQLPVAASRLGLSADDLARRLQHLGMSGSTPPAIN